MLVEQHFTVTGPAFRKMAGCDLKVKSKRPITIGKVERFHGSYVRETWRHPCHGAYIYHWNYERPHQGIDYLMP